MIRVPGGIAVSGRIGRVAGGARLAGCVAVRGVVAVAVVLRICSGGYRWCGIRRRRHGRGSRVAVPIPVAVPVALRAGRVRSARVGRRCRIRSDRRARRRGSVVSAGRRRRVAAATGRGRGGRIARGACCGSVPVPFRCRCPPEQAPATRGKRRKRGCRSRVRGARYGCGWSASRCRTSACLLPPIAPHSNPAAKAPHLPLSPEKASVDLVARSYSSTMGHSIGPRRDNTNETPGCSQRCRTRVRTFREDARARTKRPRSRNTKPCLDEAFSRGLRLGTVCELTGDACRPRRAKPLFIRR